MKKNQKNPPPKISIITPTLNQAGFIRQTIESVLNQQYPNLEYIVMDGGSTDGTLNILKRYTGKITWYSKKDKGQTSAINTGIANSTGEIIGYLNSDDMLEPGCLGKVARFFTVNNDYLWVTGKCRIIDSLGNPIRSLITGYKNFWLKYFRLKQTIFVLNYISQPATFWKREVLDLAGIFNEQYHLSMDYDYWLRLWQIGDPGYIDEYIASFRIHENSKGYNYFKKQMEESTGIIRKFSKSGIIPLLHQLHDTITLQTYRLLNE